MDTNKYGKVSEKKSEVNEGNRMAERLKTLDEGGDKRLADDECRPGFRPRFSRGGSGRGGS